MHVFLAPLAILLERLVGYPPALFQRISHPVVWMGAWLGWLDRRLNQGTHRRAKGVLALLLLVRDAKRLIGAITAFTIDPSARDMSACIFILCSWSYISTSHTASFPPGSTTSLVDALGLAIDHLRADRLDAAESALVAILERWPAQPDALHLLGVLHAQQGSPAAAIALCSPVWPWWIS